MRTSTPHLLALEPRMMFDAAAVATAQAVFADVSAVAQPDAADAGVHHDPTLAHFADAPAASSAPREIIFIDTSIADHRQLADRWAERGEVVLIDHGGDGVAQFEAALAGRSGLAAIHIVSHGEAGTLFLGTSRLDAAAIDGAFADALAQIGGALGADGDILVYGCDFADGAAGARAVERLAAATGADIAASIDPTGFAALGGDWRLEAERGTIDAAELAALDWAHTLDPNTIVPIAVTADSLTVTSGGATVVSGSTGYGTDARSPDVGVGAVARWAGAATLADGTSVDLKATVVSLSAGDAIRFNRPGIGANGDDPTFLLRDISTNSTTANDGGQVQIRWELVRAGTDTALSANIQFNILDIDGIGGAPNSRETVSTGTDGLAYFTRARTSNIAFRSSLERITASGTQNENSDTTLPVSEVSAATFDWTAVSSFTLTYQLAAANGLTNLAQFFHDGDADFVFADPVYVSIPRLDLDGNDGTAAGNDARFTYTEGDPARTVVDADIVVANPVDEDSIVGGTVVLTNAKAGDTLVVGTLPSNLTAVTTTGSGTITVTLSGAGSEEDYTAAFRAIGFFNGSDTPDPAQRVIEVSFANDTLVSALATSRIDVVPVNDAPIARADSATTPEDTPVTVSVLANDADPDGDAITITAASAANGAVVINSGGTLTYTPNANYNGTDTISYTIGDGRGGTATGSVTVTVTAVNDAPRVAAVLPGRTALDRATVSYATAAGFTDPDGTALTYTAAGLPAGLAIDAATGIVSGTIDRSASQAGGGVYTVTVTARDPAGATVAQSFTIGVTNPGPAAVNDAVTTAEDTTVTVAVLGNDSDPDGDPLRVTAATADVGAVVVNGDGTIRYTPAANFNGADTIRYTIADGQGGSASATVAVTVTAVDDAPRAAAALPPRGAADASTVSFPTAFAFTDPDGDALTFAAAGLPAGLVIDAATGIVSGTLGRSASQPGGGVYTVTVTARDAGGGNVAQSFTFTATNPIPVALDDAATTAEDTPVTIAVLGNDGDADGDPLRVTSAAAANGTVVVNPDGTLTYTPRANFNGADTINYAISDGEGGTDTATVTVTVAPINDPPQPIGTLPARSGIDGASVSIATSGSFADPDGDALTYTAMGLPSGLTIDPATGSIAGTLDRSASQVGGGTYTITITAADPAGRATTQSFTFTATNPGPVAVADAATTPEDTPVTVAVLGNDSDPDGDPLTVITAGAAQGSVVNLDGTLTYTPRANFSGTDTIAYTISDGQGGTANANVAVTITPANDAPQPIGTLASQSGVDGGAVTIPTSGGFTDIDGDALRYTAIGLPAGLAIDPVAGVIAGTLDRSASQVNGGSYAVTVTAADSVGATATQRFVLTVANPPPVARDDAATTPQDVAVTVRVLVNDDDPDGDPLTVLTATAAQGSVVIGADGTLTYTPAPGFRGTDTIRYTIGDGEGGTASATVTIGVAAVNRPPQPIGTLPPQAGVDAGRVTIATAGGFTDAEGDTLTYAATGLPAGLAIDPATGVIAGTLDRSASQANGGSYTVTVTASDAAGAAARQTFVLAATNPPPAAANDAVTTAEDTPVTFAVLANDGDPDGDPLRVTAASPARGQVVVNGDGTLTYTPLPNDNGAVAIAYTIADGEGGTAEATVTVTIVPANDAPGAAATALPPQSAADGADVTIATAPGFADPDGDVLTYSAAGLPAGLAIDRVTGLIAGRLDRSASQTGGGRYPITVTATDAGGGAVSNTFLFTATNPAPTARDDAAATPEDTAVTIAVLANDSDPDGDPLRVTGATVDTGTVRIDPAGTLTYTPGADFAGTASIRYAIADDEGGTAEAIAIVTVAPVDDAPRPAPIATDYTARDGAPVTIALGGTFVDPEGRPLAFAATGLPAGLAIDPATGIVSGTVDRSAGQVDGGRYTVLLTATDPAGNASSRVVTLTVVNPAPIARDDLAATRAGTPVTIAPLANDGDPDGDPLAILGATASDGSVTVNPDGTLTYTPAAGFTGAATIRYTIGDGEGGTGEATITVAVGNLPPAARPIADQRAGDGQAIVLPAGAAFTDPDGDALAFAATGLPPGLTIDPATGLIAGTIDRSASQNGGGIYETVVTARDSFGAAASTTIRWVVANPPPLAAADAAATRAGVAVTVAVLANDRDPDGDPLGVIGATAANGGVTINPDGTLAYTPAPGFTGTDTITYTIGDGQGGTAVGSVAVTVTPGNVAPTPADDAATTRRDVAVSLDVLANDRDADGDPLRVIAAASDQGNVAIGADGRLAFTPAAGFTGTATIRYTVSDRAGNTAEARAVVSVAAVNDPPIAADDAAVTGGGVAVIIPVLANDRDPNGDRLTVIAAGAANGTVTINPDGTLTYTPRAGFAGTDTIRYTIGDGQGGTATAVATITVTNAVAPTNAPPVIPARDAAVAAVGGVPVVIDALAGVTDADGDPLTIVSATTAVGSVTINPDGTLGFVAPIGFDGVATIGFTVSDGRGGVAAGVVPVRVADGRGADVEQLLRIARPRIVDQAPTLATVMLGEREVRSPLIIIDTVNRIRPLAGTEIGRLAVTDAADAARTLRGTAIDPDRPILAEVARLERLVDFRDAGDRLFDRRWGDFMVRGFSGFSAAADGHADIMVESVVRGRAIYIEVRDTAEDGRAAIRSVAIRPATGAAAPAWLHVDPRGLAVVERGADMDELHLIVRVTRSDGRVTSTPILIQGETGMVTLDRGGAQAAPAAPPLDATLSIPSANARAEAARLAQLFQ